MLFEFVVSVWQYSTTTLLYTCYLAVVPTSSGVLFLLSVVASSLKTDIRMEVK